MPETPRDIGKGMSNHSMVTQRDPYEDADCDHEVDDQHPITTLKLFVQLSDGVTDEAGAFRFHDVPTRCLHRAGVPRREGATRGMLQVTFGLATECRRAGTDPFAGVPPDANVVEGRFA
jgi:hypothetical protein